MDYPKVYGFNEQHNVVFLSTALSYEKTIKDVFDSMTEEQKNTAKTKKIIKEKSNHDR